MPFERPSLDELVVRIRSDFRGRLSIAGVLLRRFMAGVLATVWAGAVHMLHGHLDWLARQLFADTAERESLLRQASLYGITPTPATFAAGTVLATGTDTSPIPAETILVRDDGFTYRVTTEATISGASVSVSIEAVEAGLTGNLDVGETLSFESPVPGVDSSTTVEADANGDGIIGGVDEEDTEGTRARYELRLQEPPQGGTDPDYIRWALVVAGVSRAWVFPHENGLGTVVVRFVMDELSPIFPDAAAVTAVQASLDEQRPITAEVTAAAPTELAVAFTLSITPDTTETRTAVEAELTDLLFREAEPGDGAGRGTILLSDIETAVRNAAGVTDRVVTVPAADVVPGVGELTTLGVVTYV